MKPNPNWPTWVFQKAHAQYPQAVAAKGLYGVAFFGHGRPSDIGGKETCESIWRGLCRRILRQGGES